MESSETVKDNVNIAFVSGITIVIITVLFWTLLSMY